jgi:hypothetical protein
MAWKSCNLYILLTQGVKKMGQQQQRKYRVLRIVRSERNLQTRRNIHDLIAMHTAFSVRRSHLT